MLALIVIVAVVAMSATVVLVARRQGGGGAFRIGWQLRHPMDKVDCKPCDGTGVMWWNGKAWVIIPPHMRTYQRGRMFFKHGLANTQTCKWCRGMGFIWVRRKD